MADVFSRAKRSEVMANIRARGNKTTERRMAALLRAKSISGWMIDARDVIGRPDIYFSIARIAVFIDGCFWHGCPSCYIKPKTHAGFWAAKRRENSDRDRKVDLLLLEIGAVVVRVWEHELRHRNGRLDVVDRIKVALLERSGKRRRATGGSAAPTR